METIAIDTKDSLQVSKKNIFGLSLIVLLNEIDVTRLPEIVSV